MQVLYREIFCASTDRQKACKAGKHSCDPGQQCVNYAHNEMKMQMTCQCPVGRTRGKDCIEGSGLNP